MRPRAEYAQIPGYEQFRKELTSPIDGIEGENVRRACGRINLANEQGEPVQITFATSVHEKNPGTSQASVLELGFLRHSLVEGRGGFSKLLVEQGSPVVTEHNTKRVLAEVGLQNQLLGQAMVEKSRQLELRRASRPYTSEIKIIPEELSTLGVGSVNFDLASNPNAYDYILHDQGIQEVVQYACRCLCTETIDWQALTPDLVVELLRKVVTAPLDEEVVRKIATEYVSTVDRPSEFWDASPITESDSYREAYMAREIQNTSKGNYGLLCHTGHLVQVVQLLTNKLSKIELQDVEIAQYQLDHLKKRLQSKAIKDSLKR